MKRLVLIIGTALVLALVFFVVSVLPGKKAPENVNLAANTAVVQNSNTAVAPPTPEQTAELQDRDAVTALAVLFTERYGSYSSETVGVNVDELALLMTDKEKGAARNYVSQEKAKYARSDVSVSVLTKALSPSITALVVGKSAAVNVSAQRLEQPRGGEAVVTQPTLALQLVKQGDQWKVDAAVWE